MASKESDDRARQQLWIHQLHLDNSTDLLRYFLRRTGNVEDAADLLAECFLVAARRVGTLPADKERARMWLFGVAQHVMSNWHRGRRRHAALIQALAASLAVFTPPTNDASEVIEQVREAVDALPAPQRELIKLVHWDGFSIAQAAQITGQRESTARGRYQRAKNTLTRTLPNDVHPKARFANPTDGSTPVHRTINAELNGERHAL